METNTYPLVPTHPLAQQAATINEVVQNYAIQNQWVETDQLMQMRLLGWMLLGEAAGTTDRNLVIERSRLSARKDPLTVNAIRIWSSFVLGQGVIIDVEDTQQETLQGKLLNLFRSSARNRHSLRFKAQRKVYRAFLVEGEIYGILFHGAMGTTPILRFMTDSTEWLDPVTHPDDRQTVLYYVRRFYPTSYTFDPSSGPMVQPAVQPVIQYVRAWDADQSALASVQVPADKVLKNACVVSLISDDERGRGFPLMESSQDWVRSFRTFMADRVTLARALARFAWNIKGGGTEEQLQAVISRIENTQSDGSKIGRGTAKVFASDNNTSLSPINVSGNAADALNDARLIRQQVGAGAGVTEPNLTGDPSVGNLASLTAMDGTMARNFQTDQALLTDLWSDILAAVLAGGSTNPKKIADSIDWIEDNVDIEYPPVVTDEVQTRVDSLLAAASKLPNSWVTKQLLKTLGEKNIESVLAEMENEEELVPDEPDEGSDDSTADEPESQEEQDA